MKFKHARGDILVGLVEHRIRGVKRQAAQLLGEGACHGWRLAIDLLQLLGGQDCSLVRLSVRVLDLVEVGNVVLVRLQLPIDHNHLLDGPQSIVEARHVQRRLVMEC